jgi:hypothetical protein
MPVVGLVTRLVTIIDSISALETELDWATLEIYIGTGNSRVFQAQQGTCKVS